MTAQVIDRLSWLQELPAGWQAKGLRFMLDRNDGGAWGGEPTGSDDVIVLRSTEQTVDGRWSINEPAYRSLSRAEHGATCLIEGDLLVTKSSGSETHIGKTTIVDAEVAALRAGYSNFMQRLRASKSNHPRFVWYLLNSPHAKIQLNLESTTSTGLANLNGGLLGRLVFPAPPLREQIAIAFYLDAETARIDRLIEDKTSLLELLEEYRSSAIFELLEGASSPGSERIDPNLGWLRSVPSHWVICGLGKRYEVQLGKMLDAKQITGEHLRPYLRNQDVQWRHINVDNLPLMDFDTADQQKFSLQKGDVLVCEGGEVGRAAVWDNDFECFYQKALHRLRPLTSEGNPPEKPRG